MPVTAMDEGRDTPVVFYAKRFGRDFGRSVQTLRLRAGLSQKDMAERLGELGYRMHQTTVGKIESATRPTSIEEAAAISLILGVSLNEMLAPSGTGPMFEARNDLGHGPEEDSIIESAAVPAVKVRISLQISDGTPIGVATAEIEPGNPMQDLAGVLRVLAAAIAGGRSQPS